MPSDKIISGIQHKMLHENQNHTILILGRPGIGKSWASLRLAELIDPHFDASRIVFTPREFMAVVNSGIKPGSVIIFEEIGIGMNARDFASVSNKLLAYCFQSMRHRCFCLIMSTPNSAFLDVSARRLISAELEMKKVYASQGFSVGKYKTLQLNLNNQDIYRHLPRIRSKSGETTAISSIRIRKPSDQLVEQYEQRKSQFTSELYKDIERQLEAQDEKRKPKPTIRQLADQYRREKGPITLKGGWPHVDEDEVANRLDVGGRVAVRVKKMIEHDLRREKAKGTHTPITPDLTQ